MIGVDIESKDNATLTDISEMRGTDSLSGWWLLARRIWNSINPFSTRTRIPRFTDIMSSLAYLNHNRNVRRALTSNVMDLYLRPDVGFVQLLDYHLWERIAEIGYKFAKVEVTKWKLLHAPHIPKDERLIRSASGSFLSFLAAADRERAASTGGGSGGSGGSGSGAVPTAGGGAGVSGTAIAAANGLTAPPAVEHTPPQIASASAAFSGGSSDSGDDPDQALSIVDGSLFAPAFDDAGGSASDSDVRLLPRSDAVR